MLKKLIENNKTFFYEHSKKVVDEMIINDEFSRWLGIKVLVIDEGHCVLQMKVRKEMTNGFNIAHGGITYSC